MIEFYFASIDIYEYSKDTSRSFVFELNIAPLIFIIIASILGLINYSKKKNKSWARALLLPDEFEESDEREKQITSHACRASYVSMMYSTPIIASLFLFYPFIYETIPYYPIIIFLLLPLTQVVTYFYSWQKNY